MAHAVDLGVHELVLLLHSSVFASSYYPVVLECIENVSKLLTSQDAPQMPDAG
jgi:hypothetical protein